MLRRVVETGGFAAAARDLDLSPSLVTKTIQQLEEWTGTRLLRDGVDVALRGRAQLEDSSLVAAPLMQMPRAVAAAPDCWRRHGKPAHPSDLAAHNCLPYLLGSDATRWSFEGPGGPLAVEVRGSLRADNSLMLIDAMLRGLGVGLVPRVMMRNELAEGRLETALDDWRAEPRQLFAVYPSREHLPERVRTLVRFLRERLAGAGG